MRSVDNREKQTRKLETEREQLYEEQRRQIAKEVRDWRLAGSILQKREHRSLKSRKL